MHLMLAITQYPFDMFKPFNAKFQTTGHIALGPVHGLVIGTLILNHENWNGKGELICKINW